MAGKVSDLDLSWANRGMLSCENSSTNKEDKKQDNFTKLSFNQSNCLRIFPDGE